MGNACVTTSQSNCLARLKQEYKQVKNRIQVLRNKIEILMRKGMVHDAYIKNSELSGLQEQQKQLANAIALITKIQQQQANLERQEFVLTSLNTAQKDILKLDLKNINLNHLLLDQQRIDQALQKMEDTLSSFNDGMGLQVPQSIESNQNQEQSFLSKISNAFNRFEEVIQSLKRQLATQEEQSNHLSILFENEKREKQDKIRMYEIQIESIHENQLKTAKQQIHQLEKKLQEQDSTIDELKKQNEVLEDKTSSLTGEILEMENLICQLKTDIQSVQYKNIEIDNLRTKIQDLEIQKNQLRQFEKKSQELQSLLEKQRNNSYITLQSLQNEKIQYENQITQLKGKVNQNQQERDHFQVTNQQLKEKNKKLESMIKENKNEIDNLNLQIRQLNEEINDIKIQVQNEKEKYVNKETEISQYGKARLSTENHDFKLNLVSIEDRNLDQQYDQIPVQQKRLSNLIIKRGDSVTSLQKQSQYNNMSPQRRNQRK